MNSPTPKWYQKCFDPQPFDPTPRTPPPGPHTQEVRHGAVKFRHVTQAQRQASSRGRPPGSGRPQLRHRRLGAAEVAGAAGNATRPGAEGGGHGSLSTLEFEGIGHSWIQRDKLPFARNADRAPAVYKRVLAPNVSGGAQTWGTILQVNTHRTPKSTRGLSSLFVSEST